MIEFGGADGFPLIVPLEGRPFGAFKVELVSDAAILAFSEFQVWAPRDDGTLVNIALRREASQSSIGVQGRGARKGVNGRAHAEPAVQTKREKSPWWKLELTRRRQISHIVLYNQLRRTPKDMAFLRISGRNNGQWEVVYDQGSKSDNALALQASLRSVSARLNAVLDSALLPHIAVEGQTGNPLYGPSALGPAWQQRRRLEQLLEVVEALRGFVDTSEVVPVSTLNALRMAADALIPSTRPDRGPFSWFADLTEFEQLQPRSDNGGYLEIGVAPASPQGFMVDPARVGDDQSQAESGLSRLGDSSPLVEGTAFPVPSEFCELSLGRSDLPLRWELWGVSTGQAPQLVYDSELVPVALVTIYQVLRNLGLDTWLTLHGFLRTLELFTRYQAAKGIARFFAVDDPGEAIYENALNEIEVASFIDPGREPVSRSKHGYRTPFRLRDHVKYAKGVKFLLDVLRRDRRFEHVFPAYGTLLGFVRDGTFIAHDDDADLILVTDAEGRDGMVKTFDLVWDYLAGRGLTLFANGRNLPGYNLPVGFNVDGESVHIDIFFSYLDDGKRIIVDSKTNTFEPVNPDFVELGRFIDIQGQTFEIPRRSEELLEYLYGSGWRTPYNPRDVGYSWQLKPAPKRS